MGKIFNNRENKKIIKYKSKYLVLLILMLISVVSVISASYAVFTVQLKGDKKYSLTVGTLDFSIDNEQNSIRLMNAYPMSDTEGKSLRPYTFSITNTGTLKEYYKISLITDTESQANCTGCTFLAPSKLRYSLTVDGVVGEAKTVSDQTVLELGELTKGQTKNYELRLWLNSEATIEEENKYYYGKIKVDASQEELKETFAFGGVSFPVEKTSSTFPNFKAISSETNGRGIYKYQEDGQDIYYWRGNIDTVATEENGIGNHVIFGGYCWEMVRTTKTGGIKMIYDGIPVEVDGKQTCSNTGTASQLASTSKFNSSDNSPAYVGYMYGNTVYEYKSKSSSDASLTTAGILYGYDVEWTGTEYTLKAKDGGSLFTSTGSWSTDKTSVANGNHYTCFNVEGKCETVSYVYYTYSSYPYYIDLTGGTTIDEALEQMYSNEKPSKMKTTIEDWFESTDLDEEENLSKLEDVVYCNDRSVADMTTNGWSKDGDASKYMYYSSNTRRGSGTPDLSCNSASNNRDRFTYKDTVNGNGLLNWPVGLLTADEIMLAGGQSSNNSDYYLYTGQYYWALSPCGFSNDSAFGFGVSAGGSLHNHSVGSAGGVRPVVSLATGTTFASGGAGTVNNPYVVE